MGTRERGDATEKRNYKANYVLPFRACFKLRQLQKRVTNIVPFNAGLIVRFL